MGLTKITSVDILPELEFNFSRSAGPGGQNVNKVNTKVGLRFNIINSNILMDEQRDLLLAKWANKLTNDGVLLLTSQETRSQLMNKELVLKKLDDLLKAAFHIPKKRKATKPTKSSIKKRLNSKKHQAQKKAHRQKP